MAASTSTRTGALVLAAGAALAMLAADIMPARAAGGSKIYYKVNPSFPLDVDRCLLLNATLGMRISCAGQCSARPDCRLFCADGAACQLYSAKVSLHWAGEGNASASLSRHCYSSFADPKNIAHTATISAAEPLNDMAAKEFAVVGFNCVRGYYHQYTSRATLPVGWWAADLGRPRLISSVSVGTKQLSPTDFQDIEVRVGNAHGAGDFSVNALLASYVGPALPKEVLVFRAAAPLLGSVVSIQRTSAGGLTINSVQIIAD